MTSLRIIMALAGLAMVAAIPGGYHGGGHYIKHAPLYIPTKFVHIHHNIIKKIPYPVVILKKIHHSHSHVHAPGHVHEFRAPIVLVKKIHHSEGHVEAPGHVHGPNVVGFGPAIPLGPIGPPEPIGYGPPIPLGPIGYPEPIYEHSHGPSVAVGAPIPLGPIGPPVPIHFSHGGWH